MTNGIFLRATRSRLPGAGLMAFVLFAALPTLAAAQRQLPDQRSVFRLVTFQTAGDLRLGATQGNIYTTEIWEGKRLQKFVNRGVGPVRTLHQGTVWPNTGTR